MCALFVVVNIGRSISINTISVIIAALILIVKDIVVLIRFYFI
jgi:hypothetical protein